MRLIVKIHGGLGNQLFQYCFAKYLEKLGTVVILDTSFYIEKEKQKYPRENELKLIFPYMSYENEILEKNLFSRKLLAIAKKGGLISKCAFLMNDVFGNYLKEHLYIKKTIKLGRAFWSDKKSIYFDGYWQDIVFVKYGIDLIKHEFKRQCKEMIVSNEVVAMHIRRGDYLNISVNGQNDITLKIQYYEEALAFYKMKGLNTFEIFSDDYVWCRDNLPRLFPYVKLQFNSFGLSDIDCLYYMSKHKHIIVANSTYSLWAFYLSDADDVILSSDWINMNKRIGNDLLGKHFLEKGTIIKRIYNQ